MTFKEIKKQIDFITPNIRNNYDVVFESEFEYLEVRFSVDEFTKEIEILDYTMGDEDGNEIIIPDYETLLQEIEEYLN